MATELNSSGPAAPKTRRDLIRFSGRVAVTAPAVVVLLRASTKRAMAGPYGTRIPVDDGPTGDDFIDPCAG